MLFPRSVVLNCVGGCITDYLHDVLNAQDNLLPKSCQGQDWQGGIGLTLVDVLDTLLVRLTVTPLTLPPQSLVNLPNNSLVIRAADEPEGGHASGGAAHQGSLDV